MKVTISKRRRKTVVTFKGDQEALGAVNAALASASARPDPAGEEMHRRLNELQAAYDNLDLEAFRVAVDRVFPPKPGNEGGWDEG